MKSGVHTTEATIINIWSNTFNGIKLEVKRPKIIAKPMLRLKTTANI